MEVIKVIVKGELPKGCIECRYCPGNGQQIPTGCRVMMYVIDYAIYVASARPDWCPLVSTDDLPTDKDGWEWYMMSLIVQGKEK